MLHVLQDPTQSNYQLSCQEKRLKSWSITGKKCLSAPCNTLPGSHPGRAQHCAGEGPWLLPARPRQGELLGFTACGCEATISVANLGRDGVHQPQDLLLAPHPAVRLSQGLTPLIVPWGWWDAYGRGGTQWGPGSAGGPGHWWPGGPRQGGCRHLESRREHGVELHPVQQPASSCPGSF